MPWGQMSAVKMSTPQESNDGPILWIRPGEQLIPTADLGSRTPKSGHKRQQSELRSLQLRRTSEPRELMFEDRYRLIEKLFSILKFCLCLYTIFLTLFFISLILNNFKFFIRSSVLKTN